MNASCTGATIRKPAALGQHAGDVHDLGRCRLDWKIPHRFQIDSGRTLHHPIELRADLKCETGLVGNLLRVSFEAVEAGPQTRQDLARLEYRQPGTDGE